ncbi:hypothetical protein [Aeromonas jandaei]|uniref:hypothetical protein n=1 Tax=Aeromonas jandaei TaxID=650 RepID=UPI003EC69372
MLQGEFTSIGYNSLSFIEISNITEDKIKIKGISLWGTNTEAPRTGEIELILNNLGGEYIFLGDGMNTPKQFILTIQNKNQLTIHEHGYMGIYGLNVTFSGNYERVKNNVF